MDFTSSYNKLLLILLVILYVSNGAQSKPLIEDQDPAGNPVPYGHLPYHPSLPGAMGPQWNFPFEWWYYGGWAQSVSPIDNQPGPKFTLFLQVSRYLVDGNGRDGDTEQQIRILYGFGTRTNISSQFLANYSYATGFHSKKLPPGQPQYGLIIPPTTEDQWYCEARTTTMQATTQLTDGILGIAGASYKLELTDTSQGLHAVFIMHDPFGGILELSTKINPTYEYALPSLNIMNESYIVLNDVKYNLVDGNLWLDREMIKYTPVLGSTSQKLNSKLFPLHHQSATGKELYVGDWFAIVMNNKTVYEMLVFWPPKKNQWIVGDKLIPPIPPLQKYGVKYPYSSDWMNWKGMPAMQGVIALDQSEFNVNIFDPSNPSLSPHWKSPVSGQTYCTKWQLQIGDKQYVMTSLVPESETTGGTGYFYEGIATITDPKDRSGQPLGYAMVEEMGYTQ